MSISPELQQYLLDMKETIEAQGQKIHELENRIKTLEKQNNIKKATEKVQWYLHQSLEIIDEGDSLKLVRTESGMTALAITKSFISKITLILKDNKPQFLYVGVVDEKLIQNDTCKMSDCYMFNTSGKGRVPGEQWQDYDQPMDELIRSADRFDVEIRTGAVSVMCDLGRNVCLFPKVPEDCRVVVGIFGEGEVRIKVDDK